MTQIFFYHGAADRIGAVVTLLRKAFRQGKPVLVYAPERELAATLDRQLWLTPPTGFVPHVGGDSPLAAETPIVITRDPARAMPADQAAPATPLQHSERLLNLSAEVPPAFSRFEKLIEVVGDAEDERLAGRERVRFYKDRGYAIQYFDLANTSR